MSDTKYRIGDRVVVNGRLCGKVMNPSFAWGTDLIPVEFDSDPGFIRGVPADVIEREARSGV